MSLEKEEPSKSFETRLNTHKPNNAGMNKVPYIVQGFLTTVVLVLYLILTLGCVTGPLRQLFIVKFDNYFASALVLIDSEVYNQTQFRRSDEVFMSKRNSLKYLPSSLYAQLPSPLSGDEAYFGYFSFLPDDNTFNVPITRFGVSRYYSAGIWSWYGTTGDKHHSERIPFSSGIDLEKRVNDDSSHHITMIGLNYKTSTFKHRSDLHRINNLVRALQPLSVILLVFLFLQLLLSIFPNPLSWILRTFTLLFAFAFAVIYSIAARKYALYASQIPCLNRVPVTAGGASLAVLWIGFAVQLIGVSFDACLAFDRKRR